ncbi:hypothetical protein [Vibrio sp. MEBiC08052]|uniref:hypothetical protein n=1 Tax=Vibrio sp. MEBiC08052 TaxID=1761910 RepID=UPI00074085A8|nr:hypothetical protein [Vibrio sp. MEBiC08052]KUI98961.1 hypothetical protein VRK_19620 [Vibrio sp. MEBiC08052]
MLFVIKYIRYGVYALVAALVIGVFVKITTVSAENNSLRAKLTLSGVQLLMQTNVIAQLSQQREEMNVLLLNRQTRMSQNEEKLRHEIKSLQHKMHGNACVIPADVTKRLRQSY